MPAWLVTTLWIAGGALFAFLAVGMLLPRRFSVARSIVIAAPPERIHPHVDSFEKWPAWSPFDTDDPTIVWTRSGRQSGVGAARSWKSRKMGDGTQTITASDPARGVSMTLAMGGGFDPFDLRFDYAPEPGGTRVTWTDSGTMPAAPHWRWMGLLLLPTICGRAFERGLRELKRVVEEPSAKG